MKFELPEGHGISDELQNSPIIHRNANGIISITDAQHASFSHGIALGNSALVIAPTSSGKTEVGLVAAASWLKNGDGLSRRVIYLVSHRALARQKFKELGGQIMMGAIGIVPADLVMSTGDATLDGNGTVPEAPLTARFLVATYEKLLGLLASSGFRQDMTNFCIIADEFQLITDRHRGQSIELLFTMIKMAGFGQFIGLSAVLSPQDAKKLAGWMDVPLISVNKREVPLVLELRTTSSAFSWATDGPDAVTDLREVRKASPIDILIELEADRENNFPVAIFCMTKRRIRDLAEAWKKLHVGGDLPPQDNILDLFDESTEMSDALATYIPRGFGVHTADLIDTERDVVESKLDTDTLPVVFATTTLAQGLNYSFKTVIFDHWCRYNSQQRIYNPIPKSEFHNIAGRAGRLGLQNYGKVIFTSKDPQYDQPATQYLSGQISDQVVGMIKPELIEGVTLQLLSSGLADDKIGLLEFLKSSLSGYLEREHHLGFEKVWEQRLDAAIHSLSDRGFIE